MAVELYDEHEQSERVRRWMRENGVSILMGVVLALAGIFGWRQWQDYQSTQAALANEYYASVQREIEAGNLEAALQQFSTLREAVGEHGYVALAGLLIAGEHAVRGELDAAAEMYADLRQGKNWSAFQPMLQLRQAQLQIARGEAEAALASLQGDAPVGFEGFWSELRGDALVDLGRYAEAVQEYTAAVERYQGEGNDFRMTRTKLEHSRSLAGGAAQS